MKRRSGFVFSIILICALLVSACGSEKSPTPAAQGESTSTESEASVESAKSDTGPEAESESTENDTGSDTAAGNEEGESESAAETADEDKDSKPDTETGDKDETEVEDTLDAVEYKLSDGIKIPELNNGNTVNLHDGKAFEFAYSLGVGFNLGNTFDAYNDGQLSDELTTETCWGNPKTTRDMIKDIHELGFDTIRIPVSWHNHVDSDLNISEVWLDRVNEVVDWALDEGMYVIINIHHDNHPEAGGFYPDNEHLEQSKKYIKSIWTQLSDRFGDYDEHLIFEGMNEPRLVNHENEWWIDTNNEYCIEAIKCINELNQVFVDTVRASGRLNTARYLMCPGYDASPEGATDRNFVLPTDPASPGNDYSNGHILVSVHAYTPYSFALEYPGIDKFDAMSTDSTRDIDSFLTKLYLTFSSNGVPVVVGEFGARDKNGNLQSRVDYAAYYVKACRSRGMSCLLWDNNLWSGDGEIFGVYNRKDPDRSNYDIIAALMEYK